MVGIFLSWSFLLTCWWTEEALANAMSEHKIHNIVLYPDKHSWCKTTEIKQIVAYPGCNSVEIDNNVCVGACFSYSIPRTSPASPGDVITPYCDSCQPAHFTWKEVKLTCEGDSDEVDAESVEMVKKVQVITNCTCTSCNKDQELFLDHHKHHELAQSDVPELMSLMMQQNKQDEAAAEESSPIVAVAQPDQGAEDLENVIEIDDDKEKEEPPKEEAKVDVVRVNHKEENSDRKNAHFIEGPHHSLVIKPDVPHSESHQPTHHQHHHHKEEDEEEEVPSLLQNQFKEHNHEEYPDQLAVESRKEFMEGPTQVLTLPELIYNEKRPDTVSEEKINLKVETEPHHQHHHHHPKRREENADEKHTGIKIVDVSHHHLSPAVEGTQLSYVTKEKE